MSVYLDYNATTPLDNCVLEAMLPYLQNQMGNPSSTHASARLARGAIEQARAQVAQLVNAHPSQVIFTSGGSGANNLAIKGTLQKCSPGKLAISAIEHDSVRQPAYSLKQWQSREIPVSYQGIISLSTVH